MSSWQENVVYFGVLANRFPQFNVQDTMMMINDTIRVTDLFIYKYTKQTRKLKIFNRIIFYTINIISLFTEYAFFFKINLVIIGKSRSDFSFQNTKTIEKLSFTVNWESWTKGSSENRFVNV